MYVLKGTLLDSKALNLRKPVPMADGLLPPHRLLAEPPGVFSDADGQHRTLAAGAGREDLRDFIVVEGGSGGAELGSVGGEVEPAAQNLGLEQRGAVPARLDAAAWAAYGGYLDDHECVDPDEAVEKARAGVRIVLREGSGVSDVVNCLPAITRTGMDSRRFCFCADLLSPLDLWATRPH